MGPDPLSPLARRLCDAMAAAFPDPAVAPLDAGSLRAAVRSGVSARGGAPRAPRALRAVGPCPGTPPVPMRCYDPGGAGAGQPGRPGRPLLVFLHGGGWVLDGLETHDRLCRELAWRTGALVLAVDYRAAPEHRFPAAVDDAVSATRWALTRAAALDCDPARVLLAGDSSGGNLAASAAQVLRDEAAAGRDQRAPAGLVLVYPVLDARLDSPSAREFATGFFHTTAHQRWYWDQYLGPDGDPRHPLASPALAAPALATDGSAPDLGGLPPTLLVLADCDPLRDEGLRYARRLGAAGGQVQVALFPGVFHGFLGCLGTLPAAEDALATIAHWVGRLGGGPR